MGRSHSGIQSLIYYIIYTGMFYKFYILSYIEFINSNHLTPTVRDDIVNSWLLTLSVN